MNCCICVRIEPDGTEEERRRIVEQHQVHNRFRDGRPRHENSRCTRRMEFVIKWSAHLLGMWEPRGCFLAVSIVFAIVCCLQFAYDVATVIFCHEFDCGFFEGEQGTDSSPKSLSKTASILYTLASIGGCFSYTVFFYCLLRMDCKHDSAALAPPKTLSHDLSCTQVRTLFTCLTITCLLLLSEVGLFYYIIHGEGKGLIFDGVNTGVGCELVARCCAIVACTVFGVSSCGVGIFADDTFRRLQNMNPGIHLDEAIRIHEDLCRVVNDTVSAFSLWFVFHWILYGATCVLSIVCIDEEIASGSPLVRLFYIGTFVVIHFFLFLSPCCSAAYITHSCGGIHARINKTLSTDWGPRHMFRDRACLDQFNSYVKNRQCCFKIGRITFTSTLAWFSLLLGTTGLIFHFF